MTDMERVGLWMAAVGMFIAVGLLSSINGEINGYEKAMTEAFERGIATECVGVSGYYWECK